MSDFQISTEGSVEMGNKMGFFQRVLGVIASPSRTMENLCGKPRILFPILAMIFGMAALYALRFPLYQDTIRPAMEAAIIQQGTPVSEEQMDMIVTSGAIGGMVALPFTALFMWIAMTALIFAAVKIFKGKGSFKQYCSITGYAYVIMLLYFVLTLVASFFTNSIQLDTSLLALKKLVAPGVLTDGFAGSFVSALLKSFDFFGIWQYVVISIGVAYASKMSMKKSYIIVFTLFIASALLFAVYAGITNAGQYI
ncbi:Yip1-like protein [Anaerobacterium chartisolvens]|uniref:Yip1-like protein n=1 Tax=Anaerobacterium chartisolvens TaxID=1297424 RepID=A0A369ASL3_9FIRM|nr:Yip1 family protein [Anaerobacterium chartisolvens]RCX12221.1 Yip1-like protein [Anaerobacterium chartisolvens]